MPLTTKALEYHAASPAGKLAVTMTKPCLTQADLSLAYTPGVAAASLAIRDDPTQVYRYTGRSNLVAVVTNGTAVLGLGNIGPEAAKPVMEGKAILFKLFADIDAFDIELAALSPQDVIAACCMLEPTFGGINLEDIRAPECFEIERELRRALSIPVFHDDQHGTAVIVGAAFLNGLEVVRKDIRAIRVVVSGAGASAIACADHLMRLGLNPEQLLMCDSRGVIHDEREDGMNSQKRRFARRTAHRTLADAIRDADVFLGLSSANSVPASLLLSMARDPLVFCLANPDPEIPYDEVRTVRPDAIVGTGRSDRPNQVNNVLGFPGIFRGTLDTRASTVNERMMLAATRALADLTKAQVPDSVQAVYPTECLAFGPDYLIPRPFDRRVVVHVASAVAQAAIETGVARQNLDIDQYRLEVERRLARGLTRAVCEPSA